VAGSLHSQRASMRNLALILSFVSMVAGCATEVGDEEDLGFDDLADDPSTESQPPDKDSVETEVIMSSACTRQRFLHIANWSYVAPLEDCVGDVCKNACWGYQRRTSGFSCDYRAGEGDRIETRDGGGTFASYNEIKSLNTYDGTAVANCKHESGHNVRTYVVWNGAGWNREGISATIHFAELYGTQSQATPHFWTWYDGYRDGYAPMSNVSPETFISEQGVVDTVKRLCASTRNGWLGLYFYDGGASGGPGMSEWKRAAIIRAMNYCTTH
jgi:hypothetical protein